MTYFDDLSPYSYSEPVEGIDDQGQNVLSVGWLDVSHDYRAAPTSDEFQAALLRLCTQDEHTVSATRGYHLCNLPPCDQRESWPPISVLTAEGDVHLGSAEIRVEAPDGVTFAAPNLVYHYVVAHGYRPPEQFMEAVGRWPAVTR